MDDDDFNFDDFLDKSNSDFEMKLEEYKERMIQIAIEANYDQMEKNGINDWHLRHMNSDELKSLGATFKMMLEYFEDREEFEKCAKVLERVKTVNSTISQKTDI